MISRRSLLAIGLFLAPFAACTTNAIDFRGTGSGLALARTAGADGPVDVPDAPDATGSGSFGSSASFAATDARASGAPVASDPQGSGTGVRYQAGGGRWGDRLVVDAMFVPAAWIEVNTEDQVLGQDTGSVDGMGYGGRIGVGNRDQSVGVLYQGFDLEGDNSDLFLHSIYLDFDVRIPLSEGNGAFYFLAGGGLGAAWLDFDSGAVSGTVSEAAAQLRAALGFHGSDQLSFSFGGGGVLYGHFGDTEAYGSFLDISLHLTF